MGVARFADGDYADAAMFNECLVMAGVQGVHAWCARITYNGSSWEVDSHHTAVKLTTSALTWNGAQGELDITLTDFMSRPVVVATPVAADAHVDVRAHAESADKVVVRFYDPSDGSHLTEEATTMDFNLLIMGGYLT